MKEATLTISSDDYLEFHPLQIELYESWGERKIRSALPTYGEIDTDLEKSVSHLNYTFSDVAKILRKTEELALNTKEGMLNKIDELFSDEKLRARGPRRPGSIRIYGNGLACYYTGKNWIKLNLVRK